MLVGDKPNINLGVIGHAKAGKSTALAHLLYKIGSISEEDHQSHLEKCIAENGLFMSFSGHLHSHRENLNGTQFNKTKVLNTDKYHFTLIDTPGEVQFFKNTIQGITYSDSSLLIVSAKDQEFEESLGKKE